MIPGILGQYFGPKSGGYEESTLKMGIEIIFNQSVLWLEGVELVRFLILNCWKKESK